MNDYGIPIIEPTVDFTKVPPIHQKRTITFVNHFIINTVSFLNNFALCCDEKLFEFENKLQRVEASLEILESRDFLPSDNDIDDEYLLNKLSSIPEADLAANTEPSIQTEPNNKEVEIEESAKPNVLDVPDIVADTEAAPREEKIENSNLQPISKDPRYAKYFKMVQFGVPAQAVKLKMKQEGLDPDMLDNPGQMVPIMEVIDTNTTTDEDDA